MTIADDLARDPWLPYLEIDLSDTQARYLDLVKAFSPNDDSLVGGISLYYAMKANPDRPILECLHALGSGFEIASLGELRLLQAIGVDPATVLSSNCVRIPGHIAPMYEAGVRWYATDSPGENRKLAEAAPGSSVYVRLDSPIDDGLVGSEGKFGVGDKAACQILVHARELGLNAGGITFHVGSQTRGPRAWRRAIQRCARLMVTLRDRHGIELEMLDIGGGFPAPYADTTMPDLAVFGEVIRGAIDSYLPYSVRVVAEPGRILASPGTMVTRVIGVVERPDGWWVHTTVGAFHGFMEALESGCKLRFNVTTNRAGSQLRPYHLTGPSCDSQDTIMHDVYLPEELKVGDEIRIKEAGAYTTAYLGPFNQIPRPVTHYR